MSAGSWHPKHTALQAGGGADAGGAGGALSGDGLAAGVGLCAHRRAHGGSETVRTERESEGERGVRQGGVREDEAWAGVRAEDRALIPPEVKQPSLTATCLASGEAETFFGIEDCVCPRETKGS